MDPFTVRRVVTEVDGKGRAMWGSDGRPPSFVADPESGFGVADVWALDRAPTGIGDGADSLGEGFPLEPPVGGMSWRIIRLPAPDPRAPRERQFLAVPGREPTGGRQGMHATDTLDLVTVLDGRIELEVEDGAVQLASGDTVVQRGTEHRWRVLDGRPCTYSVVMLRPDPSGAPWPDADLAPRTTAAPTGIGPRRVVTGLDARGRSVIVSDGEAPGTFAFAGGVIGYGALWETGGPLGSPRQGGDPVRPWMQLQPIGDGVSFKSIVLPPAATAARLAMTGPDLGAEMGVRVPGMRTTGHHDPDDPAVHRTDTIDLDVIVDGEIELALPDGGPVRLSTGDCIVQRGTWHKWRNVGDTPARFTAVMLGVPPVEP
jgi:quercetin dioxygenase-like cupin family protein